MSKSPNWWTTGLGLWWVPLPSVPPARGQPPLLSCRAQLRFVLYRNPRLPYKAGISKHSRRGGKKHTGSWGNSPQLSGLSPSWLMSSTSLGRRYRRAQVPEVNSLTRGHGCPAPATCVCLTLTAWPPFLNEGPLGLRGCGARALQVIMKQKQETSVLESQLNESSLPRGGRQYHSIWGRQSHCAELGTGGPASPLLLLPSPRAASGCEHPSRSQPSDSGMRTENSWKGPGRPELPGSGDAEVSLGSCFDWPLPVPERVRCLQLGDPPWVPGAPPPGGRGEGPLPGGCGGPHPRPRGLPGHAAGAGPGCPGAAGPGHGCAGAVWQRESPRVHPGERTRPPCPQEPTPPFLMASVRPPRCPNPPPSCLPEVPRHGLQVFPAHFRSHMSVSLVFFFVCFQFLLVLRTIGLEALA